MYQTLDVKVLILN